ncbi:MAG: hypothetical protein EON59_13260 [Alphaproteobacteria bacterium]|nr:MAG: hypothetical protein EON59_13260 [Alphaproteobacteria bacterium]
MASGKRAPEPQFFVSDADKEAMAGQLVAHTTFGIERLASEAHAPLADDFLDILARASAAMIAADTHLDTPAKLRLGAETVASHVLRHLKRYRAEAEETGTAAFHRILSENEIPEVMKKAWNDS